MNFSLPIESKTAHRFKKQRGMTLIEVLVTFIVTSVGIMGLAALQATSIKGSMDTAKRSQGVWLTEELISRMRVNEAGLITGYTAAALSADLCVAAPTKMCSDSKSTTGNTIATAATDCSANEMATYDVWEVFCGHDYGAGVTSNSTDAMDITKRDISCAPTPCTTTSNFTVILEWTAKSVADASEDSATYNESATQTISVTFRP